MKNDGLWQAGVRSVEREEIRFAPNTIWQVQAQGFRVQFISDLPFELYAQDQIMITAGEMGTPSWAAFIGTVVECSSDSILLLTSPEYENRLMDIRKFERKFSPHLSLIGAREVMDRFGFFPSFHYDEITKVSMEVSEQHDSQKHLSVTINYTSAGEMEQPIDFYFEDIEPENSSPVEACNICLQLSFAYEDERIRVELDAVTGFAASFLCRRIVVQFHDS
ncbi:Imm50 family immunity protein [Paenibacillus nasutitermitis]|uniref:Uncharacterized protein n=1 Tax=Paenibacillus nasutitermitis TaxID=1652958 RepID=A0A916YTY5_9BACL|nr:Imm50 family immunity protein [Paenibacillus nasutitermitis]GGD60055.1 hypothetical protein GCM10010911_17420 [Paenibacillus nasutitermitis]